MPGTVHGREPLKTDKKVLVYFLLNFNGSRA